MIYNPLAQCYVLIIDHQRAETVTVGALGPVDWEGGWTCYIGRASRGWPTRLKRFQTDFTCHWHVDYLVTASHAGLHGVLPINSSADRECRIARTFGQLSGVRSLEEGLGNSDCAAECRTHAYVSKPPPDQFIPELDLPSDGLIRFKQNSCQFTDLTPD